MDIYCNDLPKNTNIYAESLADSRAGAKTRGEITLPALPRGGIATFIDKLLCLLDRIIGLLMSTGVLRAIRVIVSVVCFFAVVGIIGGIERGLLDWRVGIAAVLAAAVIEALCIRKCR